MLPLLNAAGASFFDLHVQPQTGASWIGIRAKHGWSGLYAISLSSKAARRNMRVAGCAEDREL